MQMANVCMKCEAGEECKSAQIVDLLVTVK